MLLECEIRTVAGLVKSGVVSRSSYRLNSSAMRSMAEDVDQRCPDGELGGLELFL